MFRITQQDVLSLNVIFSTFDKMLGKCTDSSARKRVIAFKEEKVQEHIKPIFIHARTCSDDALYKSKALGKDRISLYNSSEDYSSYRMQYMKKKKQLVAV